ncbi:hypothetical protein P4K96_18600, partial [Bacillus cereus]|nr:hypothetical protein [Bacillus cereus]
LHTRPSTMPAELLFTGAIKRAVGFLDMLPLKQKVLFFYLSTLRGAYHFPQRFFGDRRKTGLASAVLSVPFNLAASATARTFVTFLPISINYRPQI